MALSKFDNIRVVLAEPNSVFRTELKDRLQGFGFQNIIATGNLSHIVSAVRDGEVDLLIADTSLPEGDFNDYVHELRHGKHGDNPFLVVITMVNNASRAAVSAAINSGTDHVVAKPFEVADLMEKVQELTYTRKKFVVTSDYIGPDRRGTKRLGVMDVPLIDVPNPLAQRRSGGSSGHLMKRRLESAKHKINEEKVVRSAYQVGWLMDFVMPELAAMSSGLSDGSPEHLHQLKKTAQDMCERIAGTQYSHMAELCLTLSRMAQDAIDGHMADEDLSLMGRMAEIFENVFDPDRTVRAADYQRSRRMNFKSTSDDQDDQTPEFIEAPKIWSADKLAAQ